MTAPLVRHEGKESGSEWFWTFLAPVLWLHLPCSTTATLWKRGIKVRRQAAIRTMPHSITLHIRTSTDVPMRHVSVIAPRNASDQRCDSGEERETNMGDSQKRSPGRTCSCVLRLQLFP